jgi:hypothetical protein
MCCKGCFANVTGLSQSEHTAPAQKIKTTANCAEDMLRNATKVASRTLLVCRSQNTQRLWRTRKRLQTVLKTCCTMLQRLRRERYWQQHTAPVAHAKTTANCTEDMLHDAWRSYVWRRSARRASKVTAMVACMHDIAAIHTSKETHIF